MMRLVIIIAACAGLAACQQSSPATLRGVDIGYVKDASTGLCFATTRSMTANAYHVVSIASVPCSPEVLALVQ